MAAVTMMCLVALTMMAAVQAAAPVPVPGTSTVAPSALSAFVSLSIELESFPAFAGSTSAPNQYSANLLSNLGSFQKYMPVIRVGGSTQDRSIYDPNLTTPFASPCSTDPRASLCLGPSFFDSYRTFPDTLYSHGFNLAWDNATGYSTLQQTVPLACKAIGPQLNVYELGNEPDLYIGKERPANWTVDQYAAEWLNLTSHMATYLRAACPDQAPDGMAFMYPSTSSAESKFPAGLALSDVESYNVTSANNSSSSGRSIAQFSQHNYISGATSKGVTLQGTLMNHNRTTSSLGAHVRAAQDVSAIDPSVAYILGECNSLYGGGAAGLSDVFGAALWTLDFALHAASTGWIRRLHFHTSTTAAYSAWSVSGARGPGTHPPYYGQLAAARFLGASNATAVVELGALSESGYESGYAAYEKGKLARLAVLNMVEFNATSPASARPSVTYVFALGCALSGTTWTVERLTAPGSNVTTDVTFGGYAYDYATLGKPASVNGTAGNDSLEVDASGLLSVVVGHSEAAILTLS